MSVQSNDTSATALATAVQNDGIGHFGI
jgi:hypothetical protein